MDSLVDDDESGADGFEEHVMCSVFDLGLVERDHLAIPCVLPCARVCHDATMP